MSKCVPRLWWIASAAPCSVAAVCASPARLAINADDVAAFRNTLAGEDAWGGRLRASFGAAMADNPVVL